MQETETENVICKKAAILLRSLWVNQFHRDSQETLKISIIK